MINKNIFHNQLKMSWLATTHKTTINLKALKKLFIKANYAFIE